MNLISVCAMASITNVMNIHYIFVYIFKLFVFVTFCLHLNVIGNLQKNKICTLNCKKSHVNI